jgi:hypothetical protein
LRARPVSFTRVPLTFSTLPSSLLKSKGSLVPNGLFFNNFFYEGTGGGAKFALAFSGALIFQIFSLPKYYYCVQTNFLCFPTFGRVGGHFMCITRVSFSQICNVVDKGGKSSVVNELIKKN